MSLERPTRYRLPDGRMLAFDDVGDPAGRPVLYLHGTPDCRLARHPDDRIAAELGIRLVAVDRPGWGRSDAHPDGSLADLGPDLVYLLDHLGLGRVGLLGWSAGGLAALAAGPRMGDRVSLLTLVGAVPPLEAHADPAVLAALGPQRRAFMSLALELLGDGVDAAELAGEAAAHLVPDPLDHATARDHVLERAGEVGRRELAAVPGAADRLAGALLEAVAQGRAGMAQDLARQFEPGMDLEEVKIPVRCIHGALDPVSPPEVGRWLVDRLPDASLEVVRAAGHQLTLTRWSRLLVAAAPGG